MITSITLRNYKSFGRRVTVSLEPITVLVGPNNSGKSCFMSVGRLVANAVAHGGDRAVELEGGPAYLIHRPAVGDRGVELGWMGVNGAYETTLTRDATGRLVSADERVTPADGHPRRWTTDFSDPYHPQGGAVIPPDHPNATHLRSSEVSPFGGLTALGLKEFAEDAPNPDHERFESTLSPLSSSRLVRLSRDALRSDSEVVPEPKLSPTGAGLPSVLALWRGAEPEKAEQLDGFIRSCVPEIRSILVKPSPEAGKQRLWIRQADGEAFDALHVSDGVLCFVALAMLAIDAEPGSVLFLEEPERSVHPVRIHQLVELLREIVHERGCQFVLATHSRVLIDQLRDEPEAIVRFRRGSEGTEAEPITEVPDLLDALERSTPGDLVETGLFGAAPAPDPNPD